MAGSSTSWLKRAANAERDMASSRAREATVQGRAGSRWIRARARPIWGSWRAPSQPVRAAGAVSIQARMAWMTSTSAKRVITASPPGRNALASAAINRKTLCIQLARGSSAA